MAEAQRFFAPPPVQVPPAGEQQPTMPYPQFYEPDVEAKRREAEIFSNVQYILEQQIPKDASPEFRKQFGALSLFVSKLVALGNISRDDIPHFRDYLDVYRLWKKFKRDDVSVTRAVEMLMELQLTRSVSGSMGGERLAEISTRQETIVSPTQPEKKKGRFWKFWR